MNSIAIIFALANATALLFLPRKYAFLPFVVGACYMTKGQGFDIGPASFTVIRMLVFVGFVRIGLKNERPVGPANIVDKLMVLWGIAAIISSFFHDPVSSALVFRFGLVYDNIGIYFLIRVFCKSLDELKFILSAVAILLLPIAATMLIEKIAFKNLFSVFGGIPEIPMIRRGRIRAQGPFRHPILAGTIGAVCLPFAIALWKTNKKIAIIGMIGCVAIIFSSASSGPLLSAMAALGALFLWLFREKMRMFRWFGILGYVGMDLIMNRPAYYIMTSLDVAGGSTGWHRARLIQSAFEHIGEWWLGGTDYTRHWMPTGVSWSPDHTDITNYYIKMGVIGGLPLMVALIGIIWFSFSSVGKILEKNKVNSRDANFIIWALGASLFSIVTTGISVNFFDQSFVFVYLIFALISSMLNACNEKVPENK